MTDLILPKKSSRVKRKTMTKKTRFEVFKRDSFKCQYCGASAPEAILVVDHIDPISKDGADEMTNYITACQPCNAGKSDRKLDDNTTLQKQKAQLDELNERRTQLEMMMAWRNGLKGMDDDQIAVLRGAWAEGTPGWSLNASGEKELRALFKKYGLEKVLDAIETSVEQYIRVGDDGKITAESVGNAWLKIGGILHMKSMPDAQRDLYYVKGILRNRGLYVPVNIIQMLKAALANGVDIEEIKSSAKTLKNWTQFRAWLEAQGEVA